MENIKTLIAFRHGEYDHNVRIDLEGEAAYAALEKRVPQNVDYEVGLNERGVEQAGILRATLAEYAIHTCFYSPYLRALSTARIALADHPPLLVPSIDLRERDLDSFRDIPRVVFHEQYEDEYAYKQQHPLDWVPGNGESLRQVGRRVLTVLQGIDAESTYYNETIAFSTHADTMVAMRALPELGNLSEEQLKHPLTPELQNPQWVQNCQVDIYSRENSASGELADRISYFRSIATSGTVYDTGWLSLV